MKRYIFPVIAAALALAACDDEKATQPVAVIDIDKPVLAINESMTLHLYLINI